MKNTFDLKKFLIENKLTNNSRILSENTAQDIDIEAVRDLQDNPAVKKLRQQFIANPQLALKAAKFVADYVDGKVDLSGLEVDQIAEGLGSVGSRSERAVQNLSQLKDPVRSDAYWKDLKDLEDTRQANAAAEREENAKMAADWEVKTRATGKDKIKQILVSAGLGILATALVGVMTIGTAGLGLPAAILLPTIIAGSLMGTGVGAAATDGFTRKLDVQENVESPEEELEQIIAVGRGV